MITIPLAAGPDVRTVVNLDGKQYSIWLVWNQVASQWTMTLYDSAGIAIVRAVPLNTNSPVFENLRAYNVPPGLLVPLSLQDAKLTVTSFSAGRAVLQYLTADDIAKYRLSQNAGTGPIKLVIIPVPVKVVPPTTTPIPTPTPTPTPTPPSPPTTPTPPAPPALDTNIYSTDGFEPSPSIAYVTGDSIVTDVNIAGGALVLYGNATKASVTRKAKYLTSSDGNYTGSSAFGLSTQQWNHDIQTGGSAVIFFQFFMPSTMDNGQPFPDNSVVVSSARYNEPGFSYNVKTDGSIAIVNQCGTPVGNLKYAGFISSPGLAKFNQANKGMIKLDGTNKKMETWINGTKLQDSQFNPTNNSYSSNVWHGLVFGGVPTGGTPAVQGASPIQFDAIHIATVGAGVKFRSDIYNLFAAYPKYGLKTMIEGSSNLAPGSPPPPSTPTPTPPSGGAGQPNANAVNIAIADMSNVNDGTPRDQTGIKTKSAFICSGRRPNGDAYPNWWGDYNNFRGSGWWRKMEPWWVVTCVNGSNFNNMRVAVRNMIAEVQRDDGVWLQAMNIPTGGTWWDFYNGAFSRASTWEGNSQPNSRIVGGANEIILFNPDSSPWRLLHGGTGSVDLNTVIGSPDRMRNLAITAEFRLVPNSGSADVDNAKALISIGTDFFPKMSDNRNSFPNTKDVPASGAARHKWIQGGNWTRVTYTAVDAIVSSWIENQLNPKSLVTASTNDFRNNPPRFLRN